jgi:hypothetical protein
MARNDVAVRGLSAGVSASPSRNIDSRPSAMALRADGKRWPYTDTMGDASGCERIPELAWSVTAYICHVADDLRIWAERLQGVMRGGARKVASYDENLLAAARRYDAIDLRAALWSMRGAADDWGVTVLQALGREEAGEPITLVHPERGEQMLTEVARANCHDAVHHHWDVGRILGHSPG